MSCEATTVIYGNNGGSREFLYSAKEVASDDFWQKLAEEMSEDETAEVSKELGYGNGGQYRAYWQEGEFMIEKLARRVVSVRVLA